MTHHIKAERSFQPTTLNHTFRAKVGIAFLVSVGLRFVAIATLLVPSLTSRASNIFKADNATALNLASSWSNSVVPTASDVAVWSANISGALTNALGVNATWAGIKINSLGGPVQINAGNNLTNGANGIDLSAATQDLTLSNNVVIGVPQSWSVASGRTLNLGGALIKNTGGTVKFNLPDSTANVTLTNAAGALLQNGAVVYGTVNDTDFAGIDGSQRVVGGVTLGVYLSNPSGGTPNISGTAINKIYDFNTDSGGSYGFRVSGNAVIYGVRVNQPNANNISWQLNTDTKTLTANAILVTTNAGSLPVRVTGTGFFRIGSSGTQELLLFQNNLAAPLVFVSGVSITQQGTASIAKLGAGRVEIQTTASHSGGTRVYEGSLQISGGGTVGSSPLTVFGGSFIGTVGATSVAPTTFYSGATNVILVNAANGRFLQASNLSLGNGARLQFNFSNNIALSTTTAPLFVTNTGTALSLTNSVKVDVLGSLAVGQFPLVKYLALGGDGFAALSLGTIQPHTVAYLSNNVANSSIDLVVTANNQPLKWATGSGAWDLNTTANWKDATSASTTYQQSAGLGDTVVFEDTQSGASPITVTLNANLNPSSVAFSAAKNYSLTGSGAIAGGTSLTKSGSGTLTLGNTNSFTGGLNLNGGTTIFSTLANLGGGALSFAGGALQYAPGNTDDISVRALTFNSGGATIDDGGNAVTFANPIGNNGVGGFTKLGSGTLTLNGTNKFSGNTIVGSGTLALSASSYLSNSPAITVSNAATLDVVSSPLTLQNQILAGNGTVNGSITVSSGGIVSPATNGVAGTLTVSNGDLTVSGGTLAIDLATTAKDRLVINGNLTLTSGTLQLNVSGTLTNGVYKLIDYTGSLVSGAGSAANLTLTGFSQANKAATLSDVTPNEIDLIVVDNASDVITWSGAGADWDLIGSLNWLKTATPWAFTNGDFVTFDDSASGNANVNLAGVAQPATVTVNATGDYTFGGAGKISGPAKLTKSNSGTLNVLTLNDYSGGTLISGGTVNVGNGGTTGALGSGNITNNAVLIFQQPDDRTVAGVLSGTGTLTQQGGGTLTLAANNTYSGTTTISSGSLQFGTGGASGTPGTGAIVDNGALILNRSGTFSLTNPVSGSGALVKSGSGTLTLLNANNYLGDTAISNGTVKLGAAEKIPDASTVPGSIGGVILNGALDLNGFNETVNFVSGSTGVLTNSAASGTNTLYVGNDSGGNGTFNGAIAESSTGKISLVKQGASTQTIYPGNNYSGGTILSNGVLAGVSLNNGSANNALLGSGSVTFYGGTLQLSGNSGGGNSAPGFGTFANPIFVPTNQIGTLRLPSRGAFNSTVTGSGTLNVATRYIRSDFGGNWPAFNGTLNISTTSGTEDLRVNTAAGFPNAKVHLASGVNFYNLIAGAIIPIGELSGDAGSSLQLGPTGTGGAQPATWRVGLLNTTTNFDGTITDSTGIIKDGTGAWILTGANTYSGVTAVTNGTLVLANDSAASPNTSAFDLRSSSAVLDVSALTAGKLNVGAGQTLKGSGTVLGSVNISGTLSPGNGIGTLTVTNIVTLSGTAVFEINRTNSPATNDTLVAASVIAGGTLVVTNLGPDLITGSRFQLFSVPVSGSFATVTLPETNATGSISYVWTNKLAIDGSVQLLSGFNPVNTAPTNLVSTFQNGVLTLSWPADHTGWRLQVQTNTTGSGLGTNWVTVPNSNLVNSNSITVNPAAGAVFYRLVYP